MFHYFLYPFDTRLDETSTSRTLVPPRVSYVGNLIRYCLCLSPCPPLFEAQRRTYVPMLHSTSPSHLIDKFTPSPLILTISTCYPTSTSRSPDFNISPDHHTHIQIKARPLMWDTSHVCRNQQHAIGCTYMYIRSFQEYTCMDMCHFQSYKHLDTDTRGRSRMAEAELNHSLCRDSYLIILFSIWRGLPLRDGVPKSLIS